MTENARHADPSAARSPDERTSGKHSQQDEPAQRAGEPADGAPVLTQPSWDLFRPPVEREITEPSQPAVPRTEAAMLSLRFPFETQPPETAVPGHPGAVADDGER